MRSTSADSFSPAPLRWSPGRRLTTGFCLAAALLPLASSVAHAQSCSSANGSNFNGTAIAAGDFVWFNAVAKVKGIDPSTTTSVAFTGSTISFTVGATTYQLNVPDSFITFSPSATEASTSFDGVNWNTVVPSSFSKGIFLGGLPFQVPAGGLRGGINPVTWSGTFASGAQGVTVEWQWAAAVYTQFSTDDTALGVKPVDGDQSNPYSNSDHAGTPEGFKQYVTGGARGGGGSNWTGSYSGTAAVVACTVEQE
jgi:hypothetical protein